MAEVAISCAELGAETMLYSTHGHHLYTPDCSQIVPVQYCLDGTGSLNINNDARQLGPC